MLKTETEEANSIQEIKRNIFYFKSVNKDVVDLSRLS